MHAGIIRPSPAQALGSHGPAASIATTATRPPQDWIAVGHLHFSPLEYARLTVAARATPAKGQAQVSSADRSTPPAPKLDDIAVGHLHLTRAEYDRIPAAARAAPARGKAQAPPGTATLTATRTATLALASTPSVSVQATTSPAVEGGQPGVFTLTESGGNSSLLVYFQVTGGGSDPAFDDALYDSSGNRISLTGPDGNGNYSGTATIPYGSTTTTIRVQPGDDTSDSPGTEQVKLTVVSPPGGCCCGSASYAPGSPYSDTLSINDMDVTIQGPTSDASEGPPAIPQAFVVSRTGDPSAAITVQLGTVGSTAVPGVDYNYSATTADDESSPVGASVSLGTSGGSVTIPAGYSSVAITINPLDPTDSLGGPTSKVVDLQILGGCCCGLGGPGYGVDAPSSASLTIDDPDGGTPLVSLAAGQTTAIEDVQTATFAVSRNDDDGTLSPVKFLLTGASATADYQLTNDGGAGFSFNTATGEGTISFNAGQTAINFTVTTTGEVSNKALNLAMETPPNVPAPGCCGSVPAYSFGSPSSATLTLTDAPLATVGVDFDATAGHAWTGEVATFTDGDPSGSLGDYAAQINWGDGHTSVGAIAADPSIPGQFDVTGTNTYSAAGEYDGVATITDAGAAFVAGFIGVVPGTPPLPNIQVNGLQYVNSVPDNLSFSYTITGAVPSFRATLFYSKTGTYNPATDALLTSQIVATGGSNPHTGSFNSPVPLRPDPTRPYLVLVADPSNVIAESNESDNTSNSLPLPTETVVPNKTLYTLMDVSTFTVSTTVVGGSFTVQGGRVSGYPWVTLGNSNSVTWTERIAGRFVLRASQTIGGVRFDSAVTSPFTVQFPSVTTIAAQASVASYSASEFTSTEGEARGNAGAPNASGAYPNSRRREHGAYITLDTSTGVYGHTTPPVYGPWNAPTAGAGVSLGAIPADNYTTSTNPNASHNIDGSAVYVVADFHTHTPTAYRAVGRPVGPSGVDIAGAVIPGLAYDYIATTGGPPATSIPAGYPLGSPAQQYTYGPVRRSTPP